MPELIVRDGVACVSDLETSPPRRSAPPLRRRGFSEVALRIERTFRPPRHGGSITWGHKTPLKSPLVQGGTLLSPSMLPLAACKNVQSPHFIAVRAEVAAQSLFRAADFHTSPGLRWR